MDVDITDLGLGVQSISEDNAEECRHWNASQMPVRGFRVGLENHGPHVTR